MSHTVVSLQDVGLSYSVRTGLFKRFKFNALDNVSFTISKGEIFGVLGNNGSGKSTLLKVLAGVLIPDSGSIEWLGDVTRSLLALGLGFNNQLTGRDNALISCMLNGYSKADATEKLEEIKAFSELGDFFEQPVKTYSSGMRAKLGFTTGLVLDVDILLIDEVLSVGDRTFKEKAERALLNKMKGDQTVIFVSHSAKQIARLCDRCLWLNNGKIMALGRTENVMSEYHQYTTKTLKEKDKANVA